MVLSKSTNQRESNIELLRIISIIFIVFFHLLTSLSGQIGNASKFQTSLLFCFDPVGLVGVNIFIIISGYFLSTSTKLSFNHIIKFVLENIFYVILILVVGFICIKTNYIEKEQFYSGSTIGLIYNSFTNIIGSDYWFIITYLFMYLLHPFINLLTNKLSNRNFILLILISTLFSFLLPTLLFNNIQNNIGIFITSYLTGSYIRLNKDKILQKKSINYLIISLSILVFNFVLVFILLYFQDTVSFFGGLANSFSGRYNILAYFVATFLMMFTIKYPFHNKIINLFASTTLGVYILHEGKLKPILFKLIGVDTLLINSNNQLEVFKIICLWTIVVTIALMLIDLIRQFIFEKPIMKFINKYILKNHKTLAIEEKL